MSGIDELVGQRCLLKVASSTYLRSHSGVDEFKVLEVSPSGNWVKLMNLHGNKFWRAASEVAYVETLKDLRDGRPKT